MVSECCLFFYPYVFSLLCIWYQIVFCLMFSSITVSWGTQLPVNTIINTWKLVLKRLFICAPHIHFSGVLWDSVLWVSMIDLLGRKSWKGCSLLTLLCTLNALFKTFRKKSSSTWYKSFTRKMVLNWLFIGETGEETQHVHCSGLLEDIILWVSRVILGRCSWNGRALGGDNVGKHSLVHVLLFWDRALDVVKIILWS